MKKVFFIFMILSALCMSLVAKTDSKNTNKKKNIESNTTSNQMQDDLLMLQAADLMSNGNQSQAVEIYEKLYKNTKESYFLKQIAIAKAQSNDLESALDYAKQYQSKSKDYDDVEINMILAEGHIRNNEFKIAAQLLERANKVNANLQTHYILANLYLQLQKPDKALEHFIAIYNDEMSYGSKLKLEALVRIIEIYLSKGDVKRVFDYVNAFVASNELPLDLQNFVPLYTKYGNLEDLAESLKKRFSNDSTLENLQLLVATLLEIKKHDDVIEILKQNEYLFNNEARNMLMYVYANKGDFKNAEILANTLYNETNDIEYLGLSAVYSFEVLSTKDKISLKPVIETLKYFINERSKKLKDENKDLSADDAFYYNFLGYILIDYEIDIKDGLNYVSKAVAIVPDSIEYLDSLAWGLYKDKDCKKAKETMDLIPNEQVQNTDEIKKHYDLIEKKCSG